MSKKSKKRKQQRQSTQKAKPQVAENKTALNSIADFIDNEEELFSPHYTVVDDISKGCISPTSYETAYRAADYSRYSTAVSEIAKQLENTTNRIKSLGPFDKMNKSLNVFNAGALYNRDIDEDLIQRAFAADYMMKRERGYSSFVTALHTVYLEHHKDIDPKLIAYLGEDKCCLSEADIIDVTNHNMPNENSNGRLSSDIIAEAAKIISDTPDVTFLWSTSEYVYIRYDPTFDYLVHRLDFDSDTKSVTYEIVCYARYRLISCIEVIPVFQAKITVKISSIDEIARNIANIDSNAAEKDKTDLNNHSLENQQLRNYFDMRYFEQLKAKSNLKNIVTYRIDGMSTLLDLNEYCLQYLGGFLELDKNDLHSIELLFDCVEQLCIDCDTKSKARQKKLKNSDIVSAVYDYLRQQITQPISAIILANKFIHDKKMSYAKNADDNVKTTKSTKHTVVHADLSETNDQPLKRQVRKLGSDISISSFRRPRVMNEDKIIKYITMQWGRKEHLRHYKNGKIVKIKATTVHRKCDDKTSESSKTSKKAPVSYIIDKSRKED